LIPGNPADLVELPAKKRPEVRVLDREAAAVFLEAIRGNRWESLWEILLVTGLRPGEALGLKWSDVDWEGSRISVQRSLARSDNNSWYFVEPKTPTSRRSVVVPPSSMESLKRYRVKQAEERLQKGAEFRSDLDLVFCNGRGEPIDYRAAVRQHFKPLVRAAGLNPLRPYDLRHTCATLLLAGGEHPKVVAERLGHSDTAMTMNVYSHVLPTMQEGAAEKLERMLYG